MESTSSCKNEQQAGRLVATMVKQAEIFHLLHLLRISFFKNRMGQSKICFYMLTKIGNERDLTSNNDGLTQTMKENYINQK